MSFLDAVLTLATISTALIAGFVFAFSTVIMPGIAQLADRDFIRAFQVIDGVIQRGQPIFGLVWVGSAVATLLAGVMSLIAMEGLSQVVVMACTLAYLFGVQLPTFRINVPLNNALQSLDTDTMDTQALATARRGFEGVWVKWNLIRTVIATAVSAALMLVLLWQ